MSTHYDIYIATTCFNAAKTINNTIWSVITQTGGINIRYHIQDAQSTDGTQSLLQEWEEKLHQQNILPSKITFTWKSEKDSGMYNGLCRAFQYLEIPDNAFMGWINADDALWPGALKVLADISKNYPDVDWCMGWPSVFDNQGRHVYIQRNPYYFQSLLREGCADGIHWPFVQQESSFWRKRLYDCAGGLNSHFQLAGDWDLWRRFAQYAPLWHIHRQIGSFWLRPQQKSSSIEDYRHEMDLIVPYAARHSSFKEFCQSSNKLSFSVSRLIQTEDSHWIKNVSYITKKMNFFIKLYPFIPNSYMDLFRSRMYGIQ